MKSWMLFSLDSSLLVFTYRFFLYRFPQLCILAVAEDSEEPIGKGITIYIYMQRAHTHTFFTPLSP